MANFMIRFLICNIFISGIIGILLITKRIFKNNLSSRMQYNLWFLLLGLLTVPFVPLRLVGFPQIISWLAILSNSPTSNVETTMGESVGTTLTENTNWMNDFTLSVNSETPSIAGYIFLGIWVVGILAMILLVIKSSLRLRTLEKSALLLQNPEVRRLHHRCLNEMGITKNIPVYSTAFLKSPIIVGLLKPCIYLPIHLISDYNESDMRYMLLHELQHYKHKDALASYLMNLAGVVYWFNPLVWYTLKEMRNDREVACDTSVLKMLEEDAYEDYENPTFMKRLKGMTAFMLTAVLLLGLAPLISTYAADSNRYQWNSSSEDVSFVDFSTYFGEYEGSFVLYDLENNSWSIYDMEHATLRVAPNSTYKIFDALFGLEEGIITPDDSLIAWDGEIYPFEAWNADQTLQSAMNSSVNWYFQSVDEQLGATSVYNYIQKIGYGNKNISGDLSTYWMESSLEISPIEQVELLTKLHNNSFGFAPENINAVKDAIRLSSSDGGATGTNATEITMSILSDMNIWK